MRRKYLIDLPREILFNILLKVPVRSLCCIRCVSKSLLKMVDDPCFVTSHIHTLIATNKVAEVPQLMSFAKSGEVKINGLLAAMESLQYDGSSLTRGKIAIDVSTSNRYEPKQTLYRIDVVFYNLFILTCAKYGDYDHYFLVNPLKEGETLRLPRSYVNLRESDAYAKRSCYCLGMGFDNITNTYKIVIVTEAKSFGEKSRKVAQVLELGTNSWRQISSVVPSLYKEKNVCAYGDMHWLASEYMSKRSKLSLFTCSFDFKKEEFCRIPLPASLRSKELDYYQNRYMEFNTRYLNLLTLKGSMAVVDTSPSISIEIWVLKDLKNAVWSRDYNINYNHSFRSFPKFGSRNADQCGEWEYGIFFKIGYSGDLFFLDLRYGSMKHEILFGSWCWETMSVISYTNSLISLREYGNLEEADDAGVTSNLRSYGNMIEGEGFGLTGNHMLRRRRW